MLPTDFFPQQRCFLVRNLCVALTRAQPSVAVVVPGPTPTEWAERATDKARTSNRGGPGDSRDDENGRGGEGSVGSGETGANALAAAGTATAIPATTTTTRDTSAVVVVDYGASTRTVNPETGTNDPLVEEGENRAAVNTGDVIPAAEALGLLQRRIHKGQACAPFQNAITLAGRRDRSDTWGDVAYQ